jgi:hypothetical protein
MNVAYMARMCALHLMTAMRTKGVHVLYRMTVQVLAGRRAVIVHGYTHALEKFFILRISALLVLPEQRQKVALQKALRCDRPD